jgi:PKD repeat protein
MYRTIPSFFIAAILFLSLPALAQRAIIKGTVRYSNGTPAANRAVYTMPDSLAVSGCNIHHTVYTNANGFYADTLTCTNAVVKVRAKTEDCGGSFLSKDPQVPASGIVEINFSLSCSPQACKAAFTYEKDNSERSFHFNSSASEGTDITSRIWTFGDGVSLTGNDKDPHHVYTTAGNYTVCLSIRTAAGCESNICQTVVVPKPVDVVSCRAKLKAAPTASIATLKFTVDDLQLPAHDSVAYYRWDFGDGTGQSGTAAQVEHHYKLGGTYTACLVLKTLHGCESKFCAAVTAPGPVSCLARFTWERLSPKKIRVNSGASFIQAGDSIVQRRWEFGDNTTLSGNDYNPAHEFNTYGTYNVCLHIKTAKGCESSFCTTVKLDDTASTAPGGDAIRIVELYPNPAAVQLNAVLYSRNDNVKATLAVYDVYGNLKWTSVKMLSRGNNYAVIPVQVLTSGSYIFKVSTSYSVLSKNFFRL